MQETGNEISCDQPFGFFHRHYCHADDPDEQEDCDEDATEGDRHDSYHNEQPHQQNDLRDSDKNNKDNDDDSNTAMGQKSSLNGDSAVTERQLVHQQKAGKKGENSRNRKTPATAAEPKGSFDLCSLVPKKNNVSDALAGDDAEEKVPTINKKRLNRLKDGDTQQRKKLKRHVSNISLDT